MRAFTREEATTMNLCDEFYTLEGRIYIDAANHGPLPRSSVQAIEQALEWKKFPEHITNDSYFDLPDQTRTAIANLIGAEPDEIAITSGASTGIQVIASSLGFQPGDEIVVARDEFPANYYPWDQVQRNEVVVRWIDPRDTFLTAEDYFSSLNPKTRLVALSYVSYNSANRIDLDVLAEACHKRGIPILVDASQAAGAFPINVHKLGVDFLVSCGYKWLLSPYGTGFFFVSKDWLERLPHPPVYWQTVEGARDFNALPRVGWRERTGARRWDAAETASFLNIAGMEASVRFLLRVGPDRIDRHARALISQVLNGLPAGRFVLKSPEADHQRGTFVSIGARTPKQTRLLWNRLRAEKVYVSLREDGLRIAPHVYNTPAHIELLLDLLSGV